MALSHCTSMPISKREEKKKGRGGKKTKKKKLQPFLFIAWYKPFHIQPWTRGPGCQEKALKTPPSVVGLDWGAKKKQPFGTLCGWMSRFAFLCHPRHDQHEQNGWKKKKGSNFKVSPVSRGPMDSATSVPSILSSSSKTTLPLVRPLRQQRHRQGKKKKKLTDALKNNTQGKKKCLGCLRRGAGSAVMN